MENICQNYRNIIQQAIFHGIIKEEKRDFYLSAINEENGADLSEVESLLGEIKTREQYSHFKNNNCCNDLLINSNNKIKDENKITDTVTISTKKDLNENQLLFSDCSIENYSILDFKSAKSNEAVTEQTDSDFSSTKQNIDNLISKSKANANKLLTKTMKRPRKDQIIDFNVPIYVDIKKKECLVKPHIKNSIKLKKRSSSKTCHCAGHRAIVLGCEQSKESSKRILPRNNSSDVKRKEAILNISPLDSKKAASSNICGNELCPSTKSIAEAFQETDKSVKQKSVHTCLARKNNCEAFDVNTTKITNHANKLDSLSCHCHKHTATPMQHLKVHNYAANQKNKYRMRSKEPLNLVAHKSSCDSKSFSKIPLIPKREDRNLCDFNRVSQTIENPSNDISVGETTSEDEFSLHNTQSKINIRNRECGRYLNVNIICQFYPGEDKEVVDSQFLIGKEKQVIEEQFSPPEEKQLVDGQFSSVEEINIMDGNEDLTKAVHFTETREENVKTKDNVKPTAACKTEKSKKLNHLSRIFTNMKINRRQKQPEH